MVQLRKANNSFREGRSELPSPLESFEALASGEDEHAVGDLHGSPSFLKAFSQNVLHHRLMYKTPVVSGKLAKSFGNWLKGRKQRVAVKT